MIEIFCVAKVEPQLHIANCVIYTAPRRAHSGHFDKKMRSLDDGGWKPNEKLRLFMAVLFIDVSWRSTACLFVSLDLAFANSCPVLILTVFRNRPILG
jgi:hypothetical protein